ncbi:hypothetical protein ABL78_7569 [Leptomonas seymouri]|uniref:Uncharacterized protein n=1 Tax=Leptomonas seymouri TaxID=5684 RepID=A0A0N1I0F4_LEPSE|nr:hypothetical protein ABL78_7569 [Leptomonas seymouri]|eukprot:KPI83402.1 hypothetical protein ABL78_7569 [Leptomonas seymouri]
MDPPSSGPPTPSTYVSMLMEGKKAGAFSALETIRAAGNTVQIHDDTDRLPLISSDVYSNDGGASQTRQQRRGSRGHELAFRVSTPERIRRKSEMLYGEIHTLMDRHQTRSGREREVQRRISRASCAANAECRRSTSRPAESPVRKVPIASPPPLTPLPDLHQMFEESRRAHLAEAQQQRTYFPSSSKPTAYSPRNPSTFSYRFQSMEPPQSGQ